MKNSKRLLSFLLAIVVMIGSMGLVSAFAETESSTAAGGTTAGSDTTTSTLTGDPEYFLKFSEENVGSPKWLSNNDMITLYGDEIKSSDEYVKSSATSASKVTLNKNNSITLEKQNISSSTDYQYATNLEIPVTDEMRANYLKADNKILYISYYFTKANMASGLYEGEFTDCQFRVYTKFSETYTEELATGAKKERQIKLASLGKNAYQVYQQNINKSLKLLGSDNEPLENLNGVESIIFSIYSYTKNVAASLELSSITYAGVPEITAFEAPAPAGVDEYVSMTDWSKHYLKEDYGDTPATRKYSSAGGYNVSNYGAIDSVTKKGAAGWIYIKNLTAVTTRQINVFFNLDRDAFNKAIVTANQEGGSKKLTFKGKFPVIKDTKGKEMMAELEIQIYRHNGTSMTPVKEFVKPGEEFTFEIDTTDLTVNSVSSLKIALMAFWKYDAKDDVYYDVDKAKRYDKDGNELIGLYDESGAFKGYYNEKSITLLTEEDVKKTDKETGKKYDKDGNELIALKKYGSEEVFGYDNGKNGSLLQSKDVAKITAECSNGKKDVDITSKVSDLTDRTMNEIEGFFSPFFAGKEKAAEATTTKSTSATTSGNGDYEFAGEHFYDFTAQAYAETYGWGTHASFINYLAPTSYTSYEIVDKDYEKDNVKQGYKDTKNPGKTVAGDATYKADYQAAKSLVSGGYQVEIASPYPRVQQQHQAYYHISGADEDARLTNPDVGDHKNQKAQGEKYDFQSQMATALEHAQNHPDGNKRGYLAIDVYAVGAVHGYKNTYNSTYKAWCKKNNKKCVNEISNIQVLVAIHATYEGEDMSVTVMEYVPAGQKKTIYLDVSEIQAENITAVRIAAQNYANLSNREQGGSNQDCGITDVQARFSAIYVPGNKNSDLVTTTKITGTVSNQDAKKIKKLYDALPGLTVDDYETEEDYNKLAALIKAWSEANEETQKYCEEKYGIDYTLLGMLEYDVYEKIYGSGSGDYGDSPDTGDIAFPMMSLVVAGLAGYVIVRTRKKKA